MYLRISRPLWHPQSLFFPSHLDPDPTNCDFSTCDILFHFRLRCSLDSQPRLSPQCFPSTSTSILTDIHVAPRFSSPSDCVHSQIRSATSRHTTPPHSFRYSHCSHSPGRQVQRIIAPLGFPLCGASRWAGLSLGRETSNPRYRRSWARPALRERDPVHERILRLSMTKSPLVARPEDDPKDFALLLTWGRAEPAPGGGIL